VNIQNEDVKGMKGEVFIGSQDFYKKRIGLYKRNLKSLAAGEGYEGRKV
jgi:hypothetical protein